MGLKLTVNTEFLHFNANMLLGLQLSASLTAVCRCIMWFHFVVFSLVTVFFSPKQLAMKN